MSNDIQTFNNPDFGQFRTVTLPDGTIGFVGKDVAELLGYKDSINALKLHVSEDDKLGWQITTSGQRRKVTVINESGLYTLAFASKLPGARKFKHWVSSEVLPSIRQYGAYMTHEAIEKALAEPDFLIQLATTLKEEKARRMAVEAVCEEQQKQISLLGAQVDDLQLEVTGMKEKVSYLDIILATTNSVLVTQIAQDYGESSIKFNRRLNRMGIQYSRGRQWILYAPYKDCGYVASETYLIKHKDGHEEVRMITKWTQKGRRFLYEELKTAGVLPVIERTASNG